MQGLQDMVNRVVDLLGEGRANTSQSTSRLATARIVDNLNRAYFVLNAEAKKRQHRGLLRYVNITVNNTSTGSTDRRFVPADGELLGVTRRENTSIEGPSREEYVAILQNWKNGYSFYGEETYDQREDGSIFIIRDKSYLYWRVWFARTPAPLNAGTLSDSTATQVTFPASPDYGSIINEEGRYFGDMVRLTSGTYSGQTGIIIDYSYDDRVATVESKSTRGGNAFSGVPGAVDYSIVPWFDESFWELLPLMAARYLTKEPAAFDHDDKLNHLYRLFLEWLGRGDLFTTHRVIDRGTVDDGMEPGWDTQRARDSQIRWWW